MLLELTPHQEIEFLVCTTKFHISAHGDGVIALTERIKKFVNGDRQTGRVTLGEIIPLEHAGEEDVLFLPVMARVRVAPEERRVVGEERPVRHEAVGHLQAERLEGTEDLLDPPVLAHEDVDRLVHFRLPRSRSPICRAPPGRTP